MKRQPYIFAPGFSLLEVTLAAALVLGVSVAMYSIFVPASTAADVQGEVYRLDQLQQRVPGLFAASRDFTGIDSDPSLANLSGQSPWGSFGLSPIRIATAPADGWAATYLNVPVDACGKLVLHEMGHGWHDTLVDGQRITTANEVMSTCGVPAGHTVEFRAWGGLRSKDSPLTLPAAGAPPGMVLPPSVPIPPPVAAAPPPVTPPPLSSRPVPGPPFSMPPPPAPSPAPVPAPQPPCGMSPVSSQRTSMCPPPQVGTITTTQTWTMAPYPTCWVDAGTTTTNNCTGGSPAPAPPPASHPPVSICSVDFGSSVGSGQVVYIDATLHVAVTNVSGWAGATPRGICSNGVLIDWSGAYQGINNLVQSSSSPENQMATFPTYPDPDYPNGP